MHDLKPLEILVDPSFQDVKEIVQRTISHHKMLIVVGRCSVDYAGRAKSELEPGERMLMIKQDGSLLVHRGSGFEPVNWQPPGCIFHTEIRGRTLEILASRQTPKELVRIVFENVGLISGFHMSDEGEFSLYASEMDMHKAILLQPSLVENGLQIISYERKVEPGFVDVYGIDKNGRLVVIEVKRKTAGRDAVLQLSKYIDAIRSRAQREVRGILVAPDIGKGVQRLLASLHLEYRALDPRKCAATLKRTENRRLLDFLEIT